MWIDWVVAIWNIWSTIGEIVMMVSGKGRGGRFRVRVQVENKYLFGTLEAAISPPHITVISQSVAVRSMR